MFVQICIDTGVLVNYGNTISKQFMIASLKIDTKGDSTRSTMLGLLLWTCWSGCVLVQLICFVFSCTDCCFYCWVFAELWRAGCSPHGLFPASGRVCTHATHSYSQPMPRGNLKLFMSGGNPYMWTSAKDSLTAQCAQNVRDTYDKVCSKRWTTNTHPFLTTLSGVHVWKRLLTV